MIRLTLLWMFVAFLCAYAWRDWFKALCGLILLMAVVEHPDFPKGMFGIQGLNPWNLTLAVILPAWLVARGRENLKWDMPTKINWLLGIYFAIIVVAFLRLVGNIGPLQEFAFLIGSGTVTYPGLASDYIINCLKWVIPGLLLYDGCRTEGRAKLGLATIIGLYFLLAVQIIRWMPMSNIVSGGELSDRAIKILSNEVGYHRVNLSMMMAGASWAAFCCKELFNSKTGQGIAVSVAAIIALAMMMTGGRMGMVTWAGVGLVLSTLRWRKYLVIGPAAVLLALAFVAPVKERLLQGFDEHSVDNNSRIEELAYRDDGPDLYTVTSGRTFAWPFVLDEISNRPFVGYGREAMQTSGLAAFLLTEYGEAFPHPHNAYLQWVFDNGILGLIPVFIFYAIVVRTGWRGFTAGRSGLEIAAGGVLLSLVFALLIASLGSQTFYPREGAVGMWCAIGLSLRLIAVGSRTKVFTSNRQRYDHAGRQIADGQS